jgi:hypothetical protein
LGICRGNILIKTINLQNRREKMANFRREMSSDIITHNEKKVYEGYTLFAPMFSNVAWLIDMNGKVCHFWEMKYPPGVHGKLLKNGNLIWLEKGPESIQEMNGSASALVEVDWDGNEVWRYDDPMLHHDFVCLENGDILLLRFSDIPENICKNIKGGVKGTELKGKILGIQIREINRNKEVLWEWNSWEHFDTEKEIECPLGNRYTWGYVNSIDAFENGDPILSLRRLNKVIRISKKTGKIIWDWGAKNHLGHQHDVSVLPDQNITIFDNGLHRKQLGPEDPGEISGFNASRVLEVDTSTGEIIWEYIDPEHLFFTSFCGSAQRLPNKNTMVCESKRGIIFELTYDKEIVWKYKSPFISQKPNIWGWTESRMIFQAHRYGLDFSGFKGRDLDPDKFEWVIRRKSKETLDEEDSIGKRLAMAGY